jgi:hypothetical protein
MLPSAWVWSPQLNRYALYIPANQYVSLPQEQTFDTWSFSIWFINVSSGVYGTLFRSGEDGLQFNDGGGYAAVNVIKNNAAGEISPSLGIGVWHHFVGSLKSDATTELWMDGVKFTGKVGGFYNTQTARIGGGQFGSNLVGHVADALIWDRCLSESEIMGLSNPSNVTYDGWIQSLRDSVQGIVAGPVGPTYTLATSVGSFALTGIAASTTAQHKLTAGAGTFGETGVAAALTAQHNLAAGIGAFTQTGIASGLTAQHTLTAQTGAFDETGTDAGLSAQRKLQTTAATASLIGVAASLTARRQLPAGTASIALTGVNVTLTYTPTGVTYLLTADVRTFSVSGIAAGLVAARRLSSGTGVFSVTGNSASLTRTRYLLAAQACFAVSGQAVGMLLGRAVCAATASFVVTGTNVALTYSGTLGNLAICQQHELMQA